MRGKQCGCAGFTESLRQRTLDTLPAPPYDRKRMNPVALTEGADGGHDLAWQDHDGTYHFVQMKHHPPAEGTLRRDQASLRNELREVNEQIESVVHSIEDVLEKALAHLLEVSAEIRFQIATLLRCGALLRRHAAIVSLLGRIADLLKRLGDTLHRRQSPGSPRLRARCVYFGAHPPHRDGAAVRPFVAGARVLTPAA